MASGRSKCKGTDCEEWLLACCWFLSLLLFWNHCSTSLPSYLMRSFLFFRGYCSTSSSVRFSGFCLPMYTTTSSFNCLKIVLTLFLFLHQFLGPFFVYHLLLNLSFLPIAISPGAHFSTDLTCCSFRFLYEHLCVQNIYKPFQLPVWRLSGIHNVWTISCTSVGFSGIFCAYNIQNYQCRAFWVLQHMRCTNHCFLIILELAQGCPSHS